MGAVTPQETMPGAAARPHAVVVTVSDSVVAGTRIDSSGPAAVELLASHFEVAPVVVCADGVEAVESTLRALLDSETPPALILTTGGTGFGERDFTPEATRAVLDREAPGLAEAARAANPAMGRLSRGVAGTARGTVVLNLPGSERAVRECLGAVLDVLEHIVALAGGRESRHP